MSERKAQTAEENQRFARKQKRPGKAGRPKQEMHDPDAPFWIYGLHAALEALRNDQRHIHRLVATPNAARHFEPDQAYEELTPKQIDRLLPEGAVHQGIALLTDPIVQPYLDDILASEDNRPLVFLDQVTDPHNVGAILRSSAALGAAAVVTSRRNSAAVTGILAKTASGALEHVPYLQFGNLADLLERAGKAGYIRLGLDERGETPLQEAIESAHGPIALVFGAEGAGLRQRTRETCDSLVRLPTEGPIQALNVSNAVAISLYQALIST